MPGTKTNERTVVIDTKPALLGGRRTSITDKNYCGATFDGV